MLLTAIDENHKGTYDFIYLPIDFKVNGAFLCKQLLHVYPWFDITCIQRPNGAHVHFQNKCNVGYAFINMISPEHIVPFYKVRVRCYKLLNGGSVLDKASC